jgi:hypothetical protein
MQFMDLPCAMPPKKAPGMEEVIFDLKARGVLRRTFEALHLIARRLPENLSGFRFPNGAVGSLGSTARAPYPGQSQDTDYDACWTLVHEFQHSLDFVVDHPSMLNGHFLDNYPLPFGHTFDAGDCYDGQAEILRRFEGFDRLPAPWTSYLEIIDTDNDGLADRDPRLPMDEARFGSDPQNKDTDNDGLSDLMEFCAGIYQGSDPACEDTDRDGTPDGEDPFPLARFNPTIPHQTLREGEIPGHLLSQGAFFDPNGNQGEIAVHAAWDEEFLYLTFEAQKPFRIEMALDGSGHLGRFESDKAVQEGSDVYAGDACLQAAFGSPYLLLKGQKLEKSRVLSMERDGK